ncbi:MAG: relaxase/mobilization nuclease domain-containing protein [Oscillospiraceae bacterium]|nr:relaxase/mobilization nuclease domain-containing protein [Oscillospiraceae bacterium]
MATTFLKPLHAGKGRSIAHALGQSTDYVKNPDKTDGGQWVSAYQCNPSIVDAEFLFSKRQYEAQTGKAHKDSDVIAYHMRQSFKPGEITPEKANKIGYDLAMSLTKGNHAFIVCTHVDKHHIHSHIIFNSTSLDCTRKFRNFWGSSFAIRRISDILCLENGLSVIENPKPSWGSYGTWLGDKKPPTQRQRLERMIDNALTADCKSYEDFLAAMQTEGAEAKTGKHLAFKIPEGKRFIRCDSLSEDYTEDAILERLNGKREVKRRNTQKSFSATEDIRPRSLIDIQSKLAQANSPGFERWAKGFNLKAIAETVVWMKEHGISDVEKLAQECDVASKSYHGLSERTKANQARMMKAISDLQRQISNYGRTKEVYIQYKKLPRKKQAQFYEDHRENIILHENAKRHFDSLGVEKLPSIKALKQEYAALNAENKQLYPQQKAARRKMIDLLTAKSNVERFLEIKIEQPERKKQQEASR